MGLPGDGIFLRSLLAPFSQLRPTLTEEWVTNGKFLSRNFDKGTADKTIKSCYI